MHPAFRLTRRVAVAAGALTLALALPGAVMADTTGGGGGGTGATVTINPTIKVVGKLGLTVQVDVVCAPLNSYDPDTGLPDQTTTGYLDGLDVTVAQPAGRSVSVVDAFTSGVSVTCDGATPNHFTLSALSTSSPFHKGSAVASGWVTIFDPFQVSADNGSSGNVVVKLVTG